MGWVFVKRVRGDKVPRRVIWTGRLVVFYCTKVLRLFKCCRYMGSKGQICALSYNIGAYSIGMGRVTSSARRCD